MLTLPKKPGRAYRAPTPTRSGVFNSVFRFVKNSRYVTAKMFGLLALLLLTVAAPAANADNAAPKVALASSLTVYEGDLVTLDASKSSDKEDKTKLKYGWLQIKGQRVALANKNTAKPTFKAPVIVALKNKAKQAIQLTFNVTVKDTKGKASSKKIVVTVKPLGATFAVDKLSVVQGGAVSASVNSIVGGTKPYKISFVWGDAAKPEVSTLAGKTNTKKLTHSYSSAGTYKLVITLTDGKKVVRTQSFTITVTAAIADLVGVLTLSKDAVSFNTAAELKVDITGGTGPYTIDYDWGDGKSESFPLAAGIVTKTATHFYELVNTYAITVKITDAKGAVQSYKRSVTIIPVAADPLVPCNP
jgi:hypothetical protein